jgi:undecaprenyl-diphosphatase
MYFASLADKLLSFDTWIFSFLQQWQYAWLVQAAVFFTDFFSPINITIYCLALIMFLWLHRKNTHLTQFLFALSAGSITVLVSKWWFKIPRPPHPLVAETGYSFASGHAVISIIFFLLLIHAYKKHVTHIPTRIFFILFCLLLVFLIGVSRVYLGVHYGSDVIAGYAIGAIIFEISVLIFG